MTSRILYPCLFILLLAAGCGKKKNPDPNEPGPTPPLVLTLVSVDSMRITYEPGDTSAPFQFYRNFRLKPDTVWRDVYTSNMPAPSGTWRVLSDSALQKVKHLLSEVPENLMSLRDTTYHNSQNYACHGSTTVRAYKDSVRYIWYFPNCPNGVPDSVVDFATKAVEAAAYLYTQ